jgi:hypothetical protein
VLQARRFRSGDVGEDRNEIREERARREEKRSLAKQEEGLGFRVGLGLDKERGQGEEMVEKGGLDKSIGTTPIAFAL